MSFGATPSIWYANERANGRFWVTDPKFGGKVNGASDDTAAWNACEAARAAAGGVLLMPSGVSLVSSTLSPAAGAAWRGAPGSTIRASTNLTAVLELNAALGATGNSFSDLAIDGQRLCTHAVLAELDSDCSWDRCQFLNALDDGMRAANSVGQAVLSSVTQTGGGPAIAVSQWMSRYCIANGNLVAKITTGGALGTAQFQLSSDGGVTYSGVPQTLFAHTRIGQPTGASFTTDSGILLTAAAGTYVLNTTYAFSVTNTLAQNSRRRFGKCLASHCGTVYASAGTVSNYGAPTYDSVLAPGTLSCVTGSNVITGTSTTLLSTLARDGCPLRLVGLTRADGQAQRLNIACVLNDTTIIVDSSSPPLQTLNNVDYVIAVGAGFGDDPETGNQHDTVLDQCSMFNCAQSWRHLGLGAWTVNNPIMTFAAITAWTAGTVFAD